MKPKNPWGIPNRRTLSAALLASAMMASGAVAADLVVDDPFNPFTINNTTQWYDTVFLQNGASIDGTGAAELNAAVDFAFESGSVNAVTLSGAAGLTKTTLGYVTLTGSNIYTGATVVSEGILQIGNGVTGSTNGVSNFSIGVDGGLYLDLPDGGTFANAVANEGWISSISSGNVTLSGVISGGGDFYTEGTGKTTLTGENTYTGGTYVSSGTLAIGDGVSGSLNADSLVEISSSGALEINLANGGVFGNDVENFGQITTLASGVNYLTGVISGDGGLTQAGSGTTVVTGANTFTGNTAVLNGILQVGDGSTSGTVLSEGNVFVGSNGTLDINLADGETFSNEVSNSGVVRAIGDGLNFIDGEISGSGSFVQWGFGTTVFDTIHTYTGSTTVEDGTLALAVNYSISDQSAVIVDYYGTLDLTDTIQSIGSLADGPLGGGIVDITAATLITGGDNTNTTFSGEIYGDGDSILYKTGSGIWTFKGETFFDGPTVVGDGVLVVDGTINGDAYVETGGALAGRGFIAGSLFNEGIVTAGSSRSKPVGTLTIGEDFVQTSSGTYVAKIRTKSKFDRLQIGGTAYLGGNLAVLRLDGFQPKRGQSFTILNAEEGIEGRFARTTNNFPETMLELNTVYTNNSVIIEFEQRAFASLSGLTHNEKQVAKALDRAWKRDRLGKLIDGLNTLPIGDVRSQLSLLSPEDLAQIYRIGFATAQVQFVNLERRLDDVRNGAIGFSTNGLALSNSRGTINYDGMPIVNERDGLSLAGWDGKSVVSKQPVAPIVEQSRWGFFVTGVGQWADVETTNEARGSEFTTGGFTIGADYRVSDTFVVGIAGGYANTGTDLYNGGEITVNTGRGSLYASWFSGGGYINGAVGGAYNSYDTKRGTVGGKARGDTNGGEFDALLGGGYDWRVGGFSIGPVGSMQYTYIGFSGFQETGSDGPLRYNSQNQDSLKSLLGLKASYAWNVCGVVITPEVRAQWLHEFLDSTASIESGFVGGVGLFTVNGTNIGRDGVLIDAGASVQFSPAVSMFAYYTGELGRTNYSSNAVNGGFRINF